MAIAHPFSNFKTHPLGPITPAELPGLILWLKADALGLANNDPVSSWTDSSGSLHHATSTGGARPTFKTAIINSLPVLRFDGSDDYMIVSGLTKGIFTAFYVYNASTGGIFVEHSVNAGSNNGDYHYIPGGAHVAARGAGGFSAYDISAPSLATGSWRVITRQMDGTNAGHNIWVDGVLGTRSTTAGTGDPGIATTTADLYLGARAGASLFTAADYAEIILSNQVVSQDFLDGIWTYLDDKYAL